MNTFTFRPHWLLAALALLAVEVAIARYVPPGVLRGFGGDVLGLHGQTVLHRVLRIALGSTFDVWDLVAYGCGWAICRALDLLKTNIYGLGESGVKSGS
jgi:hypothetical protein